MLDGVGDELRLIGPAEERFSGDSAADHVVSSDASPAEFAAAGEQGFLVKLGDSGLEPLVHGVGSGNELARRRRIRRPVAEPPPQEERQGDREDSEAGHAYRHVSLLDHFDQGSIY